MTTEDLAFAEGSKWGERRGVSLSWWGSRIKDESGGELAQVKREDVECLKYLEPSFTMLRGKLWMNGKNGSFAGGRHVLRDMASCTWQVGSTPAMRGGGVACRGSAGLRKVVALDEEVPCRC